MLLIVKMYKEQAKGGVGFEQGRFCVRTTFWWKLSSNRPANVRQLRALFFEL